MGAHGYGWWVLVEGFTRCKGRVVGNVVLRERVWARYGVLKYAAL